MAEKISVQIALDGGKEVEQQLTGIGKAGETMADGIAKAGDASQTTGTNFDALVAATDKLTEATNKATEAHSRLSLETVKTSAEIAKLAAEIGLTGVEIVQAVRHHQTLIQSLIKLAGITNTTVKAVSLLTPELSLVGVTIGSTAAAVAAGAIAFETIRVAAEAAAGPFAKISEDLTKLSANTGETFDNLQRGKAAFEQLGIGGKDFADVITKINEATKDFDVGGKIKESADKITESVQGLYVARLNLEKVSIASSNRSTEDKAKEIADVDKLIAATNDWEKAQEAMGKAAEQNAKAVANNLKDIIPLIQQIVDGQKGLTFDGLTTAATKIDAVTAAMKKAGDSSKTAAQVLVEFIANADRLSAIQVGAKFGVNEEQVDRIRRLGGAISITDEIWKGLQSRGVLISPESAAALDKLQVSLDQAAQAKARFNQAMETSVPATFAAQISSALEDLKTKFVNLATTDIEGANRALSTLGTTSGLANTTSELEAIGRLMTLIGGQATGFSWGEIVATGGLASTREELEAIGRVITLIAGQTTSFTWGELWQTGGLANTRKELEAIGAAVDWLIDKFLKLIRVRSQAGGTAAPATGSGAPGKASGGLLGGRGSGTSDSNLAWVSRGEHIMPASVVRQPGVLAFLEALRRGGSLPRFAEGGSVGSSGALGGLINELGGAIGEVTQIWDGLLEGMQGVYKALEKALIQVVQQSDQVVRRTVEQLQKLQITLALTLGHMVNAMRGKARGGLLGGRGTGTSDSNLAWVSRGEYITPARAVAQPGVLAFLEALRRSGGNLSRVLDGMGRFALGGMVPRMAFASGGLAGGMSNVTIQFPGLPAIGGLRASSDVVDQLHRAAALAQVRSGGRKPSRYS